MRNGIKQSLSAIRNSPWMTSVKSMAQHEGMGHALRFEIFLTSGTAVISNYRGEGLGTTAFFAGVTAWTFAAGVLADMYLKSEAASRPSRGIAPGDQLNAG